MRNKIPETPLNSLFDMNNYNYPPKYPNPQGPPPSSNMVWAILTTILCCLPFGIVAIVYASKVDGYWYAGNYEAAYDASNKARNWSIAAAATSFGITLIYLACMLIWGISIGSLEALSNLS